MAKEQADASWTVVNGAHAAGMNVNQLKTTTEAKPKPPAPGDPRTNYARGIGGPWIG